MPQMQNLWKSIKGNLPPYYKVQGPIKSKKTRDDGIPCILVNTSLIEVDAVTFSRLSVGDNLKVRFTRAAKAISIDILTAPEGDVTNGPNPQ
jgi:ABC-type uncharacterized transport system YnjBCD ATPase subunit